MGGDRQKNAILTGTGNGGRSEEEEKVPEAGPSRSGESAGWVPWYPRVISRWNAHTRTMRLGGRGGVETKRKRRRGTETRGDI